MQETPGIRRPSKKGRVHEKVVLSFHVSYFTSKYYAVKLVTIYFPCQAVAVADLENIVKIAHGYHPPKMDHGPNVMWLDTTRGGVTHLIMGPTAGPTCYYPPHSDVH